MSVPVTLRQADLHVAAGRMQAAADLLAGHARAAADWVVPVEVFGSQVVGHAWIHDLVAGLHQDWSAAADGSQTLIDHATHHANVTGELDSSAARTTVFLDPTPRP